MIVSIFKHKIVDINNLLKCKYINRLFQLNINKIKRGLIEMKPLFKIKNKMKKLNTFFI